MRERHLCISIFFSHCNFESLYGIISFSPLLKTTISWRNGQDKICHHTFRNGRQGALCTHFLSGNLGFLPPVLCFFFTCLCMWLGLQGRVVVMLGLQAHTSCWKAGHPSSEAAHPWRVCCAPCSAMRGPSSLLIPNHSPCLSNFSYQLTFSLLLFRPTFVGLPKGKVSTEIN